MFHDLSIRNKLIISFSAIVAIILFLLVFEYNNFTRLEAANQWDRHSLEVLLEANHVSTSVLQVQSATRGYLLTGNDTLVAPIESEYASARAHLRRAIELTIDNRPQQQRLRELEALVAAWPAAGAGVPADLSGVPDAYPGDDAPRPEVAAWMAKQAEKRGLPPELPIMASLVESGMTNIQGGDADSVGFFQMRVGIWDKGEYRGFSKHPELQAKWFIDQALAVKKQAIARGDADFGKDPSKWGEWIADIERPAEQYRGRYQLRLKEARGLLR